MAAIKAATVSRGVNRGKLKKACPPMNTDGAAAWQAIVMVSNPYRAGIGHLIFMDDERRIIYNTIKEQLERKATA